MLTYIIINITPIITIYMKKDKIIKSLILNASSKDQSDPHFFAFLPYIYIHDFLISLEINIFPCLSIDIDIFNDDKWLHDSLVIINIFIN